MKNKIPAICEPFGFIGKLAAVLGVRDINQLPGCWEHAIDEHWWIAINGHREMAQTSKGDDVAPFHCWVEFNGWPAGYFDVIGGTLAAGEAANENAFIAALKAAITKATKEPLATSKNPVTDSTRKDSNG